MLVTGLMRLRVLTDPSIITRFQAVALPVGHLVTEGQRHRGARLVELRLKLWRYVRGAPRLSKVRGNVVQWS